MSSEPIEFVTSECPNGHRVRGDIGWLNREVSCPHCHAKFVFTQPGTDAAKVVAYHPAATAKSFDASDTGVMRILGDYVAPPVKSPAAERLCSNCGAMNPAETAVCYSCNASLVAPGQSKIVTDSAESSADEIDFREVTKVAFEDVPVRRVIRPRRDVDFLDINDSLEQMQQKVRKKMHSLYPVCDRSMDKVLGVVHIKDILVAQGDHTVVSSILRKPTVIPDTTPVGKVLHAFNVDRVQMVFVVDEFENLIGIVTLKDVLSRMRK